jgi:hypothetical protein
VHPAIVVAAPASVLNKRATAYAFLDSLATHLLRADHDTRTVHELLDQLGMASTRHHLHVPDVGSGARSLLDALMGARVGDAPGSDPLQRVL